MNKKIAIGIIAGVILIITIVGIRLLVYKNNYPHQYSNVTGTSNNININNWKMFRDELYGFEFKYPANWIDTGLNNLHSSDYKFHYDNNGGDFPGIIVEKGAFLSVRVVQQNYNYDIDRFVVENQTNATSNNIVYIEGQKGLLEEWENKGDKQYFARISFLRPYLNNSQLTFTFYLQTNLSEKENYFNLFMNMISTFKSFKMESSKAVEKCYKDKDERAKNECIEYIAGRIDNKELCNQVSGPEEYCLYIKVVKSNNILECNSMTIISFVNRCYKEIAAKNNKGLEICNDIIDEKNKRFCISSFNNN